ncbi:glutathione transferase GstA [Enterobacteriaceae bacterium LUAb1]
MKLFATSGACSLSPHIILRETGLDFTLELVDLKTKKTEKGDDYLKINPRGQVPALLLDDGTLLTEGTAIVQYLADSKADRQLLAPVNSVSRYQTLAWLNYIGTELHKGFTPLFRPDTPDEYKHLARETLEQKFRYVNNELANKQWLTGNRFSIADAYLFTVTRWTATVKLSLEDLSNLHDYMERIAKRPAVAAALKAEGLV